MTHYKSEIPCTIHRTVTEREYIMKNVTTNDVLAELTDAEFDSIIGAGDGVLRTISHECNMNSWQFMFTCC